MREEKLHKRLELLPEEALYLLERGSMFCWKDEENTTVNVEGVEGTPMTVQQAYAEMIGRADLSLEKYQVCSLSFPALHELICLGVCIFTTFGVYRDSHSTTRRVLSRARCKRYFKQPIVHALLVRSVCEHPPSHSELV